MDDLTRLSLDKLKPVDSPDNRESQERRGGRVRRVFWTRSRKEALAAWLFILPDSIGLLVFVAIPMVLALSLGFFSVDGFGSYKFVGLANYNRMLRDPLFMKSLGVTIVYVLCLVPGLYVSGLGLALLVRQRIPFVGLWRSLFFMPYVVSLVVIALTWKVMLIDKVGFINRMLELVGLQGRAWLGDPSLALGAVLVVTIWFSMGYYMVIFLSGLQDIPREYYEAARIDGANSWKMFTRITLPLLRPTSFFVLLVSTVSAVSGSAALELIYVMTSGGPANSTSLVVFYIYQQAFKYNNYGYAAAMASVLVIILLLLTILLFALTRGGRFHLQ
jgi:multiple sugar transport system permease protein